MGPVVRWIGKAFLPVFALGPGTGSVRACPCSVAVSAHSNRSDRHAYAGAETVPKLTLQLDHSMGADQQPGRDHLERPPRPTMKLSKTDFLIYRDCAHNAWLKMHKPEVYGATPPSVFDQSIMETGNEVDKLARDLFPGGALSARTHKLCRGRDAPIPLVPDG